MADDTDEAGRWFTSSLGCLSALGYALPISHVITRPDSVEVLAELEYLFHTEFFRFQMFRWESIHDYLDKNGSAREWQQFLGDDDIDNYGGEWELSPEAWENLFEAFASAGFQAVCPDEVEDKDEDDEEAEDADLELASTNGLAS